MVLGKLPVWGVLLIWIRVGQGLTALAVGAGGGCLDIFSLVYHFSWGWWAGAMVLGKLPVSERPTIRMVVGQRPIALAVGAGRGCLDIFTLHYPFSHLLPLSGGMARYRLKYCLKGPLSHKTKQITK